MCITNVFLMAAFLEMQKLVFLRKMKNGRTGFWNLALHQFSHVNFPCSKCSRRHLIVHYNFIVKSAVFIADHFSGPARAMGLVCVCVCISQQQLSEQNDLWRFDLCHQAWWFTLTLSGSNSKVKFTVTWGKILLKWSERPRVMAF